MSDRGEPTVEDLGAIVRDFVHEARSPLSTVSYACALLESQPLDEGGDRQLERIRTGVRDIATLLDGLVESAGTGT